MLNQIHFLRGLASLLVLLYHVAHHVTKYSGDFVLLRVFDFGDSGVQFFFVLSGFIILYSSYPYLGNIGKVSCYFRKRFIRIYTPYWVVITGLFIIYLLMPGFGKERHRDLVYFLESLTLLPNEQGQFMGIAWTLTYEVLFYLIFALAFINKRFIYVIITALLVLGTGRLLGTADSVWFNPNWVLFALGMVCAIVVKKYNLSRVASFLTGGGLLIYLGVALCKIGVKDSMLIPEYDLSVYGYGIASMFLIVGGCYSQIKWPKLFGDISYSLYLVHIPVIGIITGLAVKMHINLFSNQILGFSILCVVALLAAIVFTYWIELPLVKKLNKMSSKESVSPSET